MLLEPEYYMLPESEVPLGSYADMTLGVYLPLIINILQTLVNMIVSRILH